MVTRRPKTNSALPIKQRTRQRRLLRDAGVYREALGCLTELGGAVDTADTRSQCERILYSVIELGIVLARCDLHRRVT